VAVPSPKILDRVRKLLGLSQSPNEHEAARAREEALRLMRRHEITEDDVSGEVLEIIEGRADACRRDLALAASLAHEVEIVGNKRGEVAFRGSRSGVGRARECYLALLRGSDECMNDPRVRGSPEPVREAWRAAVWLGYAEAIAERCIDLREKRRTKPKIEEVVETPNEVSRAVPRPGQPPKFEADPELTKDRVVEEVRRRLIGAKNVGVNTQWLYKEAHTVGWSTGMRVDLSGNAVAAGGMLSE
jgi:hypothetical protein